MSSFLDASIKQFEYYKLLGEKTIQQVTDEQLFVQFNPESNSIAIIVNHLWGNMLSRWTNFLYSDGEKEWRNRDAEFNTSFLTREHLMIKWDEGWDCLLSTLKDLKEEDETKLIYIRNQGHTVQEAILRQLAHYAYHVGQIVYLGKIFANDKWESLSIPRGESVNYNHNKFSIKKSIKHYTDEYLRPKE